MMMMIMMICENFWCSNTVVFVMLVEYNMGIFCYVWSSIPCDQSWNWALNWNGLRCVVLRMPADRLRASPRCSGLVVIGGPFMEVGRWPGERCESQWTDTGLIRNLDCGSRESLNRLSETISDMGQCHNSVLALKISPFPCVYSTRCVALDLSLFLVLILF